MTQNTFLAAALQFGVSMDVARNLATLERLLKPLATDTLAVAPERALSGYIPEPGFVARIDVSATTEAFAALGALCHRKKLHVIAGACHKDEDGA